MLVAIFQSYTRKKQQSIKMIRHHKGLTSHMGQHLSMQTMNAIWLNRTMQVIERRVNIGYLIIVVDREIITLAYQCAGFPMIVDSNLVIATVNGVDDDIFAAGIVYRIGVMDWPLGEGFISSDKDYLQIIICGRPLKVVHSGFDYRPTEFVTTICRQPKKFLGYLVQVSGELR